MNRKYNHISAIFRAKMSMENDKRPGNGSSYKFARKRHKSDELMDVHENNQSLKVCIEQQQKHKNIGI